MPAPQRVKLDPPVGLAMLGYGNRVGRNAGIHDDLAAQALVLSDGANKVAIAGVDVLAIGTRIADDIRDTRRRKDQHSCRFDPRLRHAHAFRARVQHLRDAARRRKARRRPRPRMGTRNPREDRVGDHSSQRKSRTRDASHRHRNIYVGNQSPPDASASANSDCRKSLRPGRRGSQHACCLSRERNSDRLPDELSMPRRGAVRGQPALLARLARLRDG